MPSEGLKRWAAALKQTGGDREAAKLIMQAGNKRPTRFQQLSKVAGTAAGRGGAIPETARGAVAAYFDSEARKEVAKQATHQEGVKANSLIMHELDRPFLHYRAETGTAKKPANLNISLSILSAYFLGAMAEKAYNDGVDINNNLKPGQFIQHLQVIRAPLTEMAGGERLGVGPPAGSTISQIADARARFNADMAAWLAESPTGIETKRPPPRPRDYGL